jgi:hypothetical protein
MTSFSFASTNLEKGDVMIDALSYVRCLSSLGGGGRRRSLKTSAYDGNLRYYDL